MRLTLFMAAALVTAHAALAAPETLMSVELQSAEVREKPMPFGTILGRLAYGDRVMVLEESGAWRRVKKAVDGDLTGWIHTTALTKKHIALKAGADTGTRASSDEVAIAGKGFNPQVESQYKAGNAKLDFATIDKMVKITIPQPELQSFVEAGPAKGGVK